MTRDGTHIPVLVEEVIRLLAPQPGDTLLDATIGHGGHACAYLEATAPTGRVIGLDADLAALGIARENLKEFGERVTLQQKNFSELNDSADGGGIVPGEEREQPSTYTHILFDLGIGSHQLADATRGFSFTGEGLSMRYGEPKYLPPAQLESLNVLAKRLGYYPDVPELLQGLNAEELAAVIRTYGEERHARNVAQAIARATVTTSQQLAALITRALPSSYEHGRIHPATRTFQALRLAVNRELEALAAVLPIALARLATGGRMAVISFHSLEDRIVKNFLRQEAAVCRCPVTQPECTCDRTPRVNIITRRPVAATPEEIARNPRARSAKLRVAEKASP